MEFTFSHNRIAELRADARVSQRQLAKAVGTSQANLSRGEKGVVDILPNLGWKNVPLAAELKK